MIPDFNPATENLPPGIHVTTVEEIYARYGYNKQRRKLLESLMLIIKDLKACKCTTIYIDGSFITQKEAPEDIDGCFDLNGMDLAMLISNYPIFLSPDQQKIKYQCEFFTTVAPGGPGKLMLDFFQFDRDNRPKGILQVKI